MAVPLSDATLDRLPRDLPGPSYDRLSLSPGIVHIGLGNFHRAHQAWYLHRLFEMGRDHDWAIIGAGVRAQDAAQRDRLLAQDCLTTLIELDPQGNSAEVTGAMIGYVPVEDDNASLIAQLADPEIRIVSLTVTEGGYFLNPVTKGVDVDHPDIRHDAERPDRPRTAFGAIIAALKLRRSAGTGPLSCLSCDNLQGNGAVLRQTIVSLAELSDPGLSRWIAETCSFPNSMVDCIVPATGPTEIALARQFGVDDAAPVTHENFRQWVIEDAFCAGRPAFDMAGAVFSDRVHDFETMKIRLLNAGHQIIANPGEILGIETIAGCMVHPLIGPLLDKVAREEIAPHVPAVPGTTPAAYAALIARRFSNPEIFDTTRRVAFDGSSRHTGFVLPSLRDGLAAGTPVRGLALVEAAWARMCYGTREDGSPIAANDPLWDSLLVAAAAARERPRAWLEQSRLYGDLASAPGFANAFDGWLRTIWADGIEAAMARYVSA